ncbi:unnamed protein product [Polarella glacialis]|uniref:Guanylate kinase-like domain-containing protein n=1 Tax=Polarella glacialis TaxID=89957 RepID=A0A813LUS2_POLGL|nr:unnamed protein product [Polarella glacialis]CAE8738402.1 unnamed protein product [Polarella glacialis]
MEVRLAAVRWPSASHRAYTTPTASSCSSSSSSSRGSCSAAARLESAHVGATSAHYTTGRRALSALGLPALLANLRRRRIRWSQGAERAGSTCLCATAEARATGTKSTARRPSTNTAAPVRRAMRAEEYAKMKRQSLLDAAIVGAIGSLLVGLNSGPTAAAGFVVGIAFVTVYLLLLQRDVDSLSPGNTPFDLLNPLRILRFLLPLILVLVLGLQSSFTLGFDTWLDGLRWEPGANFTGFVTSPPALFSALLGYSLATLTLPLRGLADSAPEVRTLVKAVPGSLGVALRLTDEADSRKGESSEENHPVEVVPVLLVTGPRGCGKTTLANQLRQRDARFQAPEWVVTAQSSSTGVERKELISGTEFETLAEAGSLAVRYKRCGDDLEQIDLGLPAMAVLQAAAAGACVLDVDPPTARTLLGYPWQTLFNDAFPGRKVELRVIAVWVSLKTLDNVMERNRVRLEAQGLSTAAAQKQLKLLRTQATSDIEWALTSGNFDFTIFNEDEEAASAELDRAARYCFEDPF